MAISKEIYKKTQTLIKRSDKILLCVNNRSTFDTHLASAALYLYLKDLGKNVTLCVDKYMKDRPRKIFESMKIPFDSEFAPLRYVITINHSKGGVESVRYDDKNGKFNLYITPTDVKRGFNFKNVSFSDGGMYDLVIVLGAQKLENLGNIYNQNKDFFNDAEIINISNLVTEGFGAVSLTSCGIPVSEIMYNIISGSSSSPSINEIIKLLLMGIVSEIQLFNKSDFKITTVETMTSLVKMGADIKEAFRDVYFKKNSDFLSIIRTVMENIKIDKENKIVWSYVDNGSFLGSGVKRSELVLDGYIPFNISDDFDVAFVIYEVGKGEVWVELESNVEGVNAKNVLSSFGASGNNYRAVAVVKDNSIDQVENIVLGYINAERHKLTDISNKPSSKNILTRNDAIVHNSHAFSDQGLVTPPPLSPAQ